jgi:hypothetical protein
LENLKSNDWNEIIEVPIARPKKLAAATNSRIINRNLAKINALKKTINQEENKEATVGGADQAVLPEVVSKPKASARSKFAEFKAKMQQKASSNNNNTNDQEILIQIVTVDEKKVQEKQDELVKVESINNENSKQSILNQETSNNNENLIHLNVNSKTQDKNVITSKRRSTRRSQLPALVQPNEEVINDENSALQKKKYNLRSRPSDLIKFDSPSKNSPRRTIAKGIFTLPNFNSTIAEVNDNDSCTAAAATAITAKVEKNKHFQKANKQMDVFNFDDEFEPVTWGNSMNSTTVGLKLGEKHVPKVQTKSNKENYDFNPFIVVNSPQTPKREGLHSASNETPKSNNHVQLKNISNSPLLKLALISSHGKRQSLSTGKNQQMFQQANENNFNLG